MTKELEKSLEELQKEFLEKAKERGKKIVKQSNNNPNSFIARYDVDNDLLFIKKRGAFISYSGEMEENDYFILDMDITSKIVGIKVIEASNTLKDISKLEVLDSLPKGIVEILSSWRDQKNTIFEFPREKK